MAKDPVTPQLISPHGRNQSPRPEHTTTTRQSDELVEESDIMATEEMMAHEAHSPVPLEEHLQHHKDTLMERDLSPLFTPLHSRSPSSSPPHELFVTPASSPTKLPQFGSSTTAATLPATHDSNTPDCGSPSTSAIPQAETPKPWYADFVDPTESYLKPWQPPGVNTVYIPDDPPPLQPSTASPPPASASSKKKRVPYVLVPELPHWRPETIAFNIFNLKWPVVPPIVGAPERDIPCEIPKKFRNLYGWKQRGLDGIPLPEEEGLGHRKRRTHQRKERSLEPDVVHGHEGLGDNDGQILPRSPSPSNSLPPELVGITAPRKAAVSAQTKLADAFPGFVLPPTAKPLAPGYPPSSSSSDSDSSASRSGAESMTLEELEEHFPIRMTYADLIEHPLNGPQRREREKIRTAKYREELRLEKEREREAKEGGGKKWVKSTRDAVSAAKEMPSAYYIDLAYSEEFPSKPPVKKRKVAWPKRDVPLHLESDGLEIVGSTPPRPRVAPKVRKDITSGEGMDADHPIFIGDRAGSSSTSERQRGPSAVSSRAKKGKRVSFYIVSESENEAEVVEEPLPKRRAAAQKAQSYLQAALTALSDEEDIPPLQASAPSRLHRSTVASGTRQDDSASYASDNSADGSLSYKVPEPRLEIQMQPLYKATFDEEHDRRTCHNCRSHINHPKMRCRTILPSGHICPQVWCQHCINKWYRLEFEPTTPRFTCPKCQDLCLCSFCRKKAGRSKDPIVLDPYAPPYWKRSKPESGLASQVVTRTPRTPGKRLIVGINLWAPDGGKAERESGSWQHEPWNDLSSSNEKGKGPAKSYYVGKPLPPKEERDKIPSVSELIDRVDLRQAQRHHQPQFTLPSTTGAVAGYSVPEYGGEADITPSSFESYDLPMVETPLDGQHLTGIPQHALRPYSKELYYTRGLNMNMGIDNMPDFAKGPGHSYPMFGELDSGAALMDDYSRYINDSPTVPDRQIQPHLRGIGSDDWHGFGDEEDAEGETAMDDEEWNANVYASPGILSQTEPADTDFTYKARALSEEQVSYAVAVSLRAFKAAHPGGEDL